MPRPAVGGDRRLNHKDFSGQKEIPDYLEKQKRKFFQNHMDKLLKILQKKLSHKQMELEREKLDICQFPPFDNGTQIDFAIFEANTLHPPHVHEEGSAILYVIDGEGKIILGDKETDYLPGNIFNVPKGTRHGFSAKKETVLLSIQDKPILFKDKLDLMYDDSS